MREWWIHSYVWHRFSWLNIRDIGNGLKLTKKTFLKNKNYNFFLRFLLHKCIFSIYLLLDVGFVTYLFINFQLQRSRSITFINLIGNYLYLSQYILLRFLPLAFIPLYGIIKPAAGLVI